MYNIILTTTDSKEVAKIISDEILINKLSPCVQILAPVESSFIWKGKIERNKEFLVQIKTLKTNVESIKEIIKIKHNYKIPEIVSLNINLLDSKYRKWFKDNIKIKE